ncbi:CdaR family protein [Gracilibacillus salinarum]|uniref:CdaR family protein n=1 Tax=Gracilibacillus salinarum TaxID=2932255 RepID=A0ABY4GI76_9BACI|nr:CdaR family protein [Gracilibacillus salinarum]UOQ84056.1 CdaR family protein [Gracilibacillus salinarum]
MNSWLEKPWVIRVVALVLSVLLFVVVAFDENVYDNDDGFELPFGDTTSDTQTMEDVPVQTEIDQEKYVVSGVPETVKVSLSGSVSLVTSMVLQRNFDVFVDLEGLEPGTHQVDLEYSGIQDRLNVYIEPQEVEVTIEERASKEFNVTMDAVNRDKVEAGYEVANITTDPGKVLVTSSKSVINKIAIVKAFVDVEGFNESQTIDNVPVKVYDNQGNQLNVRIDPPTVDVEVEMSNPSKSVPITLETENELPEGIKLEETKLENEQVQIFAAESYLAELEEIKTKPIDLSKLTESGSMEVELALPSEVRKAANETVNVDVSVEKVEEQDLNDVAIQLEGEESGQTVSFVEPDSNVMNITMSGYPSDLEQISPEDLQLLVDVGGLGPGEHEVPIELITPDDVPESVQFELQFEQAAINIEEEE